MNLVILLTYITSLAAFGSAFVDKVNGWNLMFCGFLNLILAVVLTIHRDMEK